MPHTQTKDLAAEKGVLFWLCKEPDKLPQFLGWGLTADCFSHRALQVYLLCLIECQGKGITGRRGIASQLQHYDGLGANDLAKLQGWILEPPEPEIDPEYGVRTLTSLRRFNSAKSHAYDFFDNVKPITVDQELPGLVDFFLNLGSEAQQRDTRPSSILENAKIDDDYVSTGYLNLDVLLAPYSNQAGGLNRSRLIMVTMPPGQGKSTLACNMTGNLAKQELGTLFFSMEMDRKRILSWIISPMALIRPDQVWKANSLNNYEHESLSATMKILDDNVRIYDDRYTIDQMLVLIKAHQQELGKKVFMVVVDRIELILEDNKYDKRGDWKKIDERADALLGLAQQTETCILCLNQMSTEAANKWDDGMRLPSMSVFRGGAGPFISADVVIAGGRHPGSEDGRLMMEKQLCTVLDVKKVRDKGFDLGRAELKFVPEYKRLEEMT